eukprot:1799028-Amphidinium_carterae.1
MFGHFRRVRPLQHCQIRQLQIAFRHGPMGLKCTLTCMCHVSMSPVIWLQVSIAEGALELSLGLQLSAHSWPPQVQSIEPHAQVGFDDRMIETALSMSMRAWRGVLDAARGACRRCSHCCGQ